MFLTNAKSLTRDFWNWSVLGIKSPDDPIIQNSVKVIDETIRVKTPNGDAFYRYNHDGYGEMDDGTALEFRRKIHRQRQTLGIALSGERGQYELANTPLTKEAAVQRN